MKEFSYIVTDELGLHARPAGALVKKAMQYKCDITIEKSGKSASAKRLFAVMSLTVKQSNEIKFTFDGEDAEEAYTALKAFCEENI